MLRNGHVKFGVNSESSNVCNVSTSYNSAKADIEKHNFRIQFDIEWTVYGDWKSNAPKYLPNRQMRLKESKSKDIRTMDILEEGVKRGYLGEYNER